MRKVINKILIFLTGFSYILVAIIHLFRGKVFEPLVLTGVGILLLNIEIKLSKSKKIK